MKPFNKAPLFITLAVSIGLLSASVNAQVVVTIHQPPPGQLNVEDLWSIDLTNNTQETFTVYLRGTAAEERDGLIFEGSSNTLSLPPGFKRVNLTDITIDVDYSHKKYEDIVLRTGSVPEGNYTVCIHVISTENGEELGRDCIQQWVAHPSPPQLTSPKDGATVEDEFPVFSWMPPMPLVPEASYDLNIVQVLDGQTPIDAMQSNPAWFEQEGIRQTFFRYPFGARDFESGKTYCWQVQALDSKGFPIGENEGKSEVQYFDSVHPNELYRNYVEEWTWYFNDWANALERYIKRLEEYLKRYEGVDSALKGKIEGLKAQLKELEEFLEYLWSEDSDEEKLAAIKSWFWNEKMMKEWEDRYKFEHPDPSDFEHRLLFFREQRNEFNRIIEDVIDEYEELEVEAVTLELISPSNGEEIDTPTPRFEWTPIDTSTLITLTVTPEVSYNLIIWQLPEDLVPRVAGGYVLTEKDLAELEPYFFQQEIDSTSFVYPEDVDNPLVPGSSYSWQVQAFVGNNNIAMSGIQQFRFAFSISPGALWSRCKRLAAIAMGWPLRYQDGRGNWHDVPLGDIYDKANGRRVTFDPEYWGIPADDIEDGEIKDEALERFKDLVDRCREGQPSNAVSDLLIGVGLVGIGELGPIGNLVSALASGIIADNAIEDDICDLLRAIRRLLSARVDQVQRVAAQEVINKWADIAGLPRISSVIPGGDVLVSAVNNLSQDDKRRIIQAIDRFLAAKCR